MTQFLLLAAVILLFQIRNLQAGQPMNGYEQKSEAGGVAIILVICGFIIMLCIHYSDPKAIALQP